MITDQKQTGVPSATRGRMQLVNPVQTNNSGLVQTPAQRNSSLNPEKALEAMKSEKYNPIQAKDYSSTPNPLKAPSVAPRPSATHSAVTTDAQGYNSQYGYDTGVTDPATGENLFMNADAFGGQGTVATPSYQDLFNGVSVDQFGRYLAELPEEDQMRFLENYSKGVYKQNGRQDTVMTGEPNETNTVGTRIQNLGQVNIRR